MILYFDRIGFVELITKSLADVLNVSWFVAQVGHIYIQCYTPTHITGLYNIHAHVHPYIPQECAIACSVSGSQFILSRGCFMLENVKCERETQLFRQI